MNKQDVVKAVYAKLKDEKVTKVAIEKVLNTLENTVHDALSKKEKVQLTGFITIKPVKRSARKGFDPLKKEPIDIPASVGVSVKAGEKLKKAVEGLKVADFE